jgi:hypothetical protein
MSIPPRATPRSTQRVEISEVSANGGRNFGLIWILVASVTGAALMLGVIWTIFSTPMAPEGGRAHETALAPAGAQTLVSPPRAGRIALGLTA